jgi:hypothetical protein
MRSIVIIFLYSLIKLEFKGSKRFSIDIVFSIKLLSKGSVSALYPAIILRPFLFLALFLKAHQKEFLFSPPPPGFVWGGSGKNSFFLPLLSHFSSNLFKI